MYDFRFLTMLAIATFLFSCNGCNQAFDNEIKLNRLEEKLEVIQNDIKELKFQK